MLENAGLIDIDEKGPTALEPVMYVHPVPVMCTRWWSMNAVDAIYCARCSMALNEQVVMKVGQSADGVVESEGYGAFPGWLRGELGWLLIHQVINPNHGRADTHHSSIKHRLSRPMVEIPTHSNQKIETWSTI